MSSGTGHVVTPSRPSRPSTDDADTPPPSKPRGKRRFGSRLPLSLKLSRGRVGGLAAVALAVAGGALFVTVGGVLAETGARSHMPIERMPDADAVVAAQQVLSQPQDMDPVLPERRGLPETLVGEVEALPEVEAAVGDIGFPAAVATGDDVVSGWDPRTTGRNWSSVALLDSPQLEGDAPGGGHEVVLDAATADAANVEIGDDVSLVVSGDTDDYRLSGTVDSSVTSVLFDDETAMSHARRDEGPRAGTVDTIGVRAAPEVSDDALADAIQAGVDSEEHAASLVVHTGDSRGDAESPQAAASGSLLISLAASLSGVVLIVVGFSIAGALSVSVASQRHQLALMRTIAATPRQIRRLVTLPNVAVTFLALPLGIAAGYLASSSMFSMLTDYGLLPAELPLVTSPAPALAACVLLTLTVWLAATAASRRTSRIAPVEALAETKAEPRAPRPLRVRIGIALLGLSIAASLPPFFLEHELTMATTGLAGIIAAVGLALVGPALVRRIAGMVMRLLPASISPLTWLSIHNLHGHSYRVGGAVAALAMTVTFILGQGYAQLTMATAGAEEAMDGMRAEHQVTADAHGGVPSDLVAEVRAIPTVGAAEELTHTDVIWPYVTADNDSESFMEEPAQVLGPGAGDVLDLDVTEGEIGSLEGSTVALSSSFAQLYGMTLGGSASFYLGDGERVTAEVVALYDRGLGHPHVTLAADLAEGHITGDLPGSLLVRAESGQEEDTAAALDQLTAEYPGVHVTSLVSTNSAADGDGMQLPPNMMINFVVITALLGYLLLSVTNRLIAETLQRGTEVATLRSLGMTAAQVRSMLRRESLMVTVMASTFGVLACVVPLAVLGVTFLGRPWPGGPLWLLPAALGIVAVVSWLSFEYSAARLTRAGDGARIGV